MNNLDERTKQTNDLLSLLSEELDISEAKYEEAEKRYKALGDWLGRADSKVRTLAPEIYVQGSFRLGTVVKPVTEDGEYDIDAVCKLELTTAQCTQEELKKLIGDEVKAYAKAQSMKKDVTEGKRCWTLNYADESRFHMDVLPAIPNAESFRLLLEKRAAQSGWTNDAIAITDNTHTTYKLRSPDWPLSNPKGYSDWFRERMKVASRRTFSEDAALMNKYATVEKVPAYRLKTPLQRVVQVLKRHRDIMFDNSPDKPISIIISTLAAHAYDNESNAEAALKNIVNNMLNYITTKNGVKWVTNPVNPLENFADKWTSHPQRELNFYKWHTSLKETLGKLTGSTAGMQNFSENLVKLAGKQTATAIMNRYGNAMREARDNGLLRASPGTATLGLGAIGTTVKSHTFHGK